MSEKGSKLNTFKQEYIGKVYGWLECIDIVYENDTYKAICKCKCGNTKSISLRSLKDGRTKSCGCFKKSKEFSESQRQYILDRPEIIERGISGTKRWCKEHPELKKASGEKYSEWCKNNPDKVREKEERHKRWFIEHHEEFEQQTENQRQYYRDHPEARKEISERQKKYYAEHHEAINKMSHRMVKWHSENKEFFKNRLKKFHSEHPEVGINNGKKYHIWAKNNPDKIAERSRKLKETLRKNPDIVRNNALHYSELCKRKRINVDYTELLKIIHPSHIEDLLNGNIKAGDKILTKCPICGKYSLHSFNGTFSVVSGNLKAGRGRLCDDCEFTYSTSKPEQKIYEYVTTIYSGECIRNSRDIISPLELDLYYPEKKIAIEYNGDYWHSEEFKDKDYHYNKFKMCNNLGITLVSIFESEWNSRSQEIKEYLKDLFNGKENSLSFINNETMNNNYPLPYNVYVVSNSREEHFYMFKESKVYTCGFTKLSNSYEEKER